MGFLLLIAGALAALGTGIWIGLGAPGWPRRAEPGQRRLEKRSINPISRLRPSSRDRPSVRRREERR